MSRLAQISTQRNETVLAEPFLETFEYTVLVAARGGRGLELASTHAVDIVIVDYFMPEMNGQQVAIQMRRLKPQRPIIMFSASVDVAQQALKLVDAFTLRISWRASYHPRSLCYAEADRAIRLCMT